MRWGERMKSGYFITSDGAHIYYEDRGRGDPIIFLPGHMCTTKFFSRNASYFEKTNRVICIDSRGFGNSTKPLHGNSIARHAKDVKELIDYLELDNVTLLGWSLSGSVILTYSHLYHDYQLKGIGLIDCCLFPFSPDEWNTYNSKNYNMDDWNHKYIPWYTDIDLYLDTFVNRVGEHLTGDEQRMVRDEIIKTPPWIGFALHSDWCHTNAVSLLGQLTVPAIIFSGSSSGHGYEMGRYYVKQLSVYSELHEFNTGGHMLFYVEAERFNMLLKSFIKQISPPIVHNNN